MLYRLNVSGDMLSCGNLRNANSGNTGTYECEFTFTGEWAELSAFGVFITKDNAYSVPIIGGKCIIAAEALSTNGVLDIGVFGTNGSDTDLKRISTNLVRVFIDEGAYRDAAAPETPTPDAWEIYAAEIKKLQQAAASSASSALSSKTAAEAAQGKAETAQEKAEEAQGKAESAKSAAETAKTAAEAAQEGAETAKAGAEEERQKAEFAKGAAEAAKASAAEAARNALLSSESAETAEKNAKDAEQGAKTAEQSTKEALTGYVKKTDIYDSNENISAGKLKNCAMVKSEAPGDVTPATFEGAVYIDDLASEIYICLRKYTDGRGMFVKLAKTEDLVSYLKKADLLDSGGKITGDKLKNCAKYSYEAPKDGETAADFTGQIYLDQATHTVYVCEAATSNNGYFLKLPSNSDLEKCVKKTDYATASSPGVVRLVDSVSPGNNPAVMTEDALDEYLGKNNYIKQQEVPGALTAGKYIDISSDGKITAKALNNYGTPSDMTNFSDSVLLTPNNMPEMMAITLTDSGFGTFMTDARKDAALQNLGAAKESDVAYASQTAKGTIRAWLTTENGESVLNLATEDSE